MENTVSFTTALPMMLWVLNIMVVIGSLLLGFWMRQGRVLVNKIQKFKWRNTWDDDEFGDWRVVYC